MIHGYSPVEILMGVEWSQSTCLSVIIPQPPLPSQIGWSCSPLHPFQRIGVSLVRLSPR